MGVAGWGVGFKGSAVSGAVGGVHVRALGQGGLEVEGLGHLGVGGFQGNGERRQAQRAQYSGVIIYRK